MRKLSYLAVVSFVVVSAMIMAYVWVDRYSIWAKDNPGQGKNNDREAPVGPSNLTTQPGDGWVKLSWDAATDNRGVSGYNIYVDGGRVGATSELNYQAGSLANGRTYTFKVTAFDAAGNESTGITKQDTPRSSVAATPAPTKVAPRPTSVVNPTSQPSPSVSSQPSVTDPNISDNLTTSQELKINIPVRINAAQRIIAFSGRAPAGADNLFLVINSPEIREKVIVNADGTWQLEIPYNSAVLKPGKHSAHLENTSGSKGESVSFIFPYIASYAIATDVPQSAPYLWFLSRFLGIIAFIYIAVGLLLMVFSRRVKKNVPVRMTVVQNYFALLASFLAAGYLVTTVLNFSLWGISWPMATLFSGGWGAVLRLIGALLTSVALVIAGEKAALIIRKKISLPICLGLNGSNMSLFMISNLLIYHNTSVLASTTSIAVFMIWLVSLYAGWRYFKAMSNAAHEESDQHLLPMVVNHSSHEDMQVVFMKVRPKPHPDHFHSLKKSVHDAKDLLPSEAKIAKNSSASGVKSIGIKPAEPRQIVNNDQKKEHISRRLVVNS